MESSISINNISVSYNKINILKNISTSFNKNSITCIIGSSGCGKTTFLKTLNASILLDDYVDVSGEINIENDEIYNYNNLKKDDDNLVTLRKNVAMVMQTPVVFPFSIYKNLEYVLNYHYSFSKKEKDDKINEVLKLVKLDSEINDLNKNADKLSGGQKQRLCLARSLLTNPKVLLLDEPCSSLDIINTNYIEDLLLTLKNQMTIIIVTHNIGEAKKLKDNVLFMSNGEILEENNNIFQNPKSNEAKRFIEAVC